MKIYLKPSTSYMKPSANKLKFLSIYKTVGGLQPLTHIFLAKKKKKSREILLPQTCEAWGRICHNHKREKAHRFKSSLLNFF